MLSIQENLVSQACEKVKAMTRMFYKYLINFNNLLILAQTLKTL